MNEPSVWVPFVVLAVSVVGLVVALARLRGQVAQLSERIEYVDRRASSAARPVEKDPRESNAHIEAVAPAPATAPTTAATGRRALERSSDPLPATGFTDQVLAESVIKGAGLLHGLRRALTPQSRNKIAFSMRQEIKRSRKQRRTDVKAARRHLAALERAELSRDEDAA